MNLIHAGVLPQTTQALIFFAQGVLIAPVSQGFDLPPWLRRKEAVYSASDVVRLNSS
jgi:hypothetical protein